MDLLAEVLIDPFRYSFMVRALVVSTLVGVMCPVVGVYVVVRGLGFMSDALAHAVLPGMVVALLLGASIFVGAIPVALAAALLIGYLIKRTGIREDTSVGIVFAGAFALGLVLATAFGGVAVNLEDILLGQVLGVSANDMYVTMALAGAVLALVLGIHKELVFSNFDPSGAAVIGLPTGRLEYLLLGILSVVVVMSLTAVGVILVISMLITPAATALMLVRNFSRAMVTAVVFGVASAVVGLYLSWHFNLPSGPLMALTAIGFFGVAIIYQGQAARMLRRRAA